jgi:hypothetical protein
MRLGDAAPMSKTEILWTSKYWRVWAKDARTKAAETKDLAAKAALEQKAARYQRLAKRQTSN